MSKKDELFKCSAKLCEYLKKLKNTNTYLQDYLNHILEQLEKKR